MNTKFNFIHFLLMSSWTLLMYSFPCFSQQGSVPNASFEEGETSPRAWQLSGGVGEWESEGHTGSRSVSVSGTGAEEDFNYWICSDVRFEPNQNYRISCFTKVSQQNTGGAIMIGTSFTNRSYHFDETEWTKRSFIFTTPADTKDTYLRFGQFEKSGTVWFDDIELVKVEPIYHRVGDLELGKGEQVQNGIYTAQLDFRGHASYSARALQSHSASFNTNSWWLKGNADIVYCHQVGKYSQKSASVTVQIGWYRAGECVVDASADGENWTEIGRFSEAKKETFALPADLFPLTEAWIRLRAAGEKTSFQIHSYAYKAQLDDKGLSFVGTTDYLEILTESESLPVEILSLGDLYPGGDSQIQLRLNHTVPQGRLNAKLEIHSLSRLGEQYSHSDSQAGEYKPGEVINLKNDLKHVGDHEMDIIVTREEEMLYHAHVSFNVPHLYESNFGYFLADDPTSELWWCEGTYKISRERPGVDPTREKVIRICAAKNEYEPFQLVLRPKQDLHGITVQIGDFASKDGHRISAENVTISLVEYILVSTPTDKVGSVGTWPDPLPPLDGPFDARANMNQPLWITVYVPKDADSGEYQANIILATDTWQQSIPIRLDVWNFSLPEETHVRTAFGFSSDAVKDYHHLETEEELQAVLAKYYQNFSAHRISPYGNTSWLIPTMRHQIRFNFGDADWIGGQWDSSTAFDGKQSLKLDATTRVAVCPGQFIPVEPLKSYKLSWAVKTEKAKQEYLVTLNCYDEKKKWLSDHNIDLLNTGSLEWEQKAVLLGSIDSNNKVSFPDEARFVRLSLRLVLGTESEKDTGAAWFDLLEFKQIESGLNLITDPSFEQAKDIEAIVDYSEFLKMTRKWFEEYRFNTIRIPLFQGVGDHGWFAGFKQGTPEHELLFTKYIRGVRQHFEANAWLDKAYIYKFCEPKPRDYGSVREGMGLIHRAAPKLMRFLTTKPVEPLYGYVEIWCPNTPIYDFEKAEKRRKMGEHIWWYAAIYPPAEPHYCTPFIDHYAVEKRVWLWQTWKYKVEGIVDWHTNYWTSPAFPPPQRQNPYTDPMSYYKTFRQDVAYIPYYGNGDGRFLYPPKTAMESNDKCFDEPVNSIRWEILREGIEDYEYFWLLRNLVERAKANGGKSDEIAKAEALLQIPDSITESLTEFSLDPKPLYEHRDKVAEAIENLLWFRK